MARSQYVRFDIQYAVTEFDFSCEIAGEYIRIVKVFEDFADAMKCARDCAIVSDENNVINDKSYWISLLVNGGVFADICLVTAEGDIY